jgi:hypothetical protein
MFRASAPRRLPGARAGEQTRSARAIAGRLPAAIATAGGVNGMTATTTWTRVSRRLGLDHNQLRRRSDVVEAWILPAAIALLLALSPLLAVGASAWVHDEYVAVQQAERSWHRVTAVLLQGVPGPLMSDNGANTWVTWTPARWSENGRTHVGQVPADAGTSAGSTVPVWLDRAGNVQAPPLTPGQVGDRVVLAAAIVISFFAAFLTMLALIGRRVLDRRRLASWGRAWLSVGPQWSRRG